MVSSTKYNQYEIIDNYHLHVYAMLIDSIIIAQRIFHRCTFGISFELSSNFRTYQNVVLRLNSLKSNQR